VIFMNIVVSEYFYYRNYSFINLLTLFCKVEIVFGNNDVTSKNFSYLLYTRLNPKLICNNCVTFTAH
jgi:hypothetical protein